MCKTDRTLGLSLLALLLFASCGGEPTDDDPSLFDEDIESTESALATTLKKLSFNSSGWSPWTRIAFKGSGTKDLIVSGSGVYGGSGRSAKWTATNLCSEIAYTSSTTASTDYVVQPGHYAKVALKYKAMGNKVPAKLIVDLAVDDGVARYTKEVYAGTMLSWGSISVQMPKNTSSTSKRVFITIGALNACTGSVAPFEFWLDNIRVTDVQP